MKLLGIRTSLKLITLGIPERTLNSETELKDKRDENKITKA